MITTSINDSRYNWGGEGYPLYEVNLSAAAPAAPSAPAAGAPSAPASPASPSGPGTPGPGPTTPPASSVGTGAPPATPTGTPTTPPADANDANIAILRQSHETLRTLGGPEAVKVAVERYQRTYTAAKEIAVKLGYTPESFEEAWDSNQADTIAFLQQEHATVSTRDRTNPEIGQEIDRRLAPINQVLAQQMAREANQRLDGEFTRLLGEHALFKGKSIPKPVSEFIENQFVDRVKWDDKLQGEVLSGKVSGVQKHFDAAVAATMEFLNKWNEWSGNTAPGTPTGSPATPGTPAAPAKRPANFLSSLAEGDDEAFQHLAITRR